MHTQGTRGQYIRKTRWTLLLFAPFSWYKISNDIWYKYHIILWRGAVTYLCSYMLPTKFHLYVLAFSVFTIFLLYFKINMCRQSSCFQCAHRMMSFLNLHPVCIYLLLFMVRLLQRSVTLFGFAPLFSFSLSLTLPQTFPFSQRQNKLIRSEVQAYQWGISIQIKTLSGHKQQEAKQALTNGRTAKRGRESEGEAGQCTLKLFWC